MQGSNFDLAPQDWATLRGLLDTALELPAAERDGWVEQLDARYVGLKPRLRALLAHAESPVVESLLNTLPKVETDQFAPPPKGGTEGGLASPTRIGPYRLLRQIGEGGMATVWLAERTDVLQSRQVALKLPHGAWRRAGLAERMAREREILATLEHPHIARLYDAGVADDGQPYLAIEYVVGEPLDQYCARNALGVEPRLQLFLQVLGAVANAHAHLVVHRDLKPSNILVDASGQARLLDFGIAKLLAGGDAPQTPLTEQAGRALTPDYASPEQIAGRPIGTGSDIYSLGVVLYELLAGQRPYHLKRGSAAALEEAILQADPPRPSAVAVPALRRQLQGDLDTIVMKALRKVPAERYATVDALADDIDRHLLCRPVLARPDSLVYTLRRWVQRQRLAFAAAAAVTLAVLAGAGVALWQAQVATAERLRADQVKDFVTGILRDANIYEGGDAGRLSAIDLVRQARLRFDAARIEQPEVHIELAKLIAESLIALNDVDAAEPLLQQALAQAKRELGDAHPQTLRARLLMSQLDRIRGRALQQRAEFDTLLPLLRQRAAAEPELLVVGLQHQTLNAIDQGQYESAVAVAQEGADLARARLGEQHPETVASTLLLALAHRYARHYELALQAAERGWQLTQQVHRGPHLHPRWIEARSGYGRSLADVGRLQQGVAEIEASMADAKQLYGESSVMVGMLRQNLVAYRLDLGQLSAAEADCDEAVRIALPGVEPESYRYAGIVVTQGNVLLAQRRYGEALDRITPAAATLGRVLGESHDVTLLAHAQEALALAGLNRLQDSADIIAAAEVHSRGNGVSALTRARLALAQAVVERRRGQPAVAAQRLQLLLADTDPAPRLQRERARARVELGMDQLALGEHGNAAATFQAALAELARLEVEPTPTRAEALAGLVRAQSP